MAFPSTLDDLYNTQRYVDGTTVIQAAELNKIQQAVDALEAKVGINNSGVTTSHDYKHAHKGIFASGATVFNTTVTANNVFQDLNLSSIVGSNVALVFLEIMASGLCTPVVKPKGTGGASWVEHANSTSNYNGGGTGAACVEANNYRYFLTATDSSGVIQIACESNAITLTIKLIAYIK